MERNSIGDLWERKSKKGYDFWGGDITIHGECHKIVIFKNKYKRSSKSPDFSIYESIDFKSENKGDDKNSKNKSQETNHNISAIDLPF